jgi:acetolactate synthase-1/2/3 large subunit
MQRVADYIAEYIYKLGIERVFMVSGGGMMFLSDGLAQHPKLVTICTHHEQAAAMAGVGYAKCREGLAAVYVTTGCGGTNAVTGLLNAWQDNVPCLFVSGQCKRKDTIRHTASAVRQLGVQEADIIAIVRSITKYAEMVTDPNKIAWHLDRAVYLMRSGRPGPAWLDIPMDVQGAMIDEQKLERFDPPSAPLGFKMHPTTDEIMQVRELLSSAKRPVIVAGQGIRLASAVACFRDLVETSGIPVVASHLAIDILPSAHPLFIGRIGTKGDRAGNFAVQNADLVISIGCRLSVSSIGYECAAFAREAKIVVVDIDPLEHSKNTVRIDLLINADAKCFLNDLGTEGSSACQDWGRQCLVWKNKWPVCLPEYAGSPKINTYYFVDRLCRKMGQGAVVVADAGSAFYVAAQGVQLNDTQRYITSGAQAEMGFALPGAIGASMAQGGKEVIAITGDGSLQMNIQELQTIVHHQLPVKLFVWNNDGYLSIRATQAKFFNKRFIGTDSRSGVSFPDLQKIAAAYGIPFFKVQQSSELDGVIAEVLSRKGPVMCEVMCIPDQEVIPCVASLRKDDGTMVSKPLEDMYPFMSREEFLADMIVKPLDE